MKIGHTARRHYFDAMLLAMLACTCDQASSADYVCPRSNLYLDTEATPDGNGISLSGNKSGLPYPRAQDDYWRAGMEAVSRTFITMRLCSSETHFCADVLQHPFTGKATKYRIVLPKTLTIGETYEVDGVVGVVTPAGNPIDGPVIGPGVAQVTIWQKVNGKRTPIKLQVESGRGVVYWDGFQLWGKEAPTPEMCILQAQRGIFSGLSINPTIAYPKSTKEAFDIE
jgi:hypothetical protein